MSKTINASIIGVTGYTGIELVRVLQAHPLVKIKHLVSRQDQACNIGEVISHLKGSGHTIENVPYDIVARDSDVVFLALPHTASQEVVKEIRGQTNNRTKIIDLGADFRLNDADTYQRYYGSEHSCAEFLNDFIYGAPEFYREELKTTSYAANPGCYALLLQIMLRPFKGGMDSASIMAVTGSSGFGKSANDLSHHPVYEANMQSYKINSHRHTPEILATSGLREEQLNIVPTLGPFIRGIFATAFIQTTGNKKAADFDLSIYKDHPFVRMQDIVTIKNIAGSNYCDLNIRDGGNGTIIVQGALDNLTKGSSGNAMQCMNLMFGFDEDEGLRHLLPVYP